ncbi:hypothetical protein WS46_17310 [Burkholderia sp. RF4-BP95]|nr:hypothetical protein WS45_04280 [Burkholderia sp. RF2-non_BP3]KUY81218.1 hypothetical protein WS46_17310 [Burkholderia sp. RF4-BP95]
MVCDARNSASVPCAVPSFRIGIETPQVTTKSPKLAQPSVLRSIADVHGQNQGCGPSALSSRPSSSTLPKTKAIATDSPVTTRLPVWSRKQ